MPMYQPDLDVGGGAQVLYLETAVKDGILGGRGGGGGGGAICGGSVQKLDLKKMIEELEPIDLPSLFICPISLEPMLDPVTLCTSQTYERSNILKWFSLAHYTCPTTMQGLWDDSITPNKTFQQLMYSWFSQKYLAMVGLMKLVRNKKHQNGVSAGLELLKTICSHEPSVGSLIVNIGVVPQLVELLPNLNNKCLEFAMYILEVLSTLPEGTLALKDCPNTITNMMKLLMGVTESFTWSALSILLGVCKLAPEECASLLVEAGLAANLLLVIQSGCSPILKQ